MAKLAQRFGFNLTDTLARHGEVLANLFQRVFAAILKAETHFYNLLFARAQRLQHFGRLLSQVEIDYRFRRRHHPAVDQEVARVRFFLFAYGSLQRNRFLRDP